MSSIKLSICLPKTCNGDQHIPSRSSRAQTNHEHMSHENMILCQGMSFKLQLGRPLRNSYSKSGLFFGCFPCEDLLGLLYFKHFSNQSMVSAVADHWPINFYISVTTFQALNYQPHIVSSNRPHYFSPSTAGSGFYF